MSQVPEYVSIEGGCPLKQLIYTQYVFILRGGFPYESYPFASTFEISQSQSNSIPQWIVICFMSFSIYHSSFLKTRNLQFSFIDSFTMASRLSGSDSGRRTFGASNWRRKDVARSSKESKRKLTIIHNYVVDMTEFFDRHPGGPEVCPNPGELWKQLTLIRLD